MKSILVALTALSLTAGAVAAAPSGQTNERPGTAAVHTEAKEVVEVRAGTVMSSTELTRAGLKADDKLVVTRVPSVVVAQDLPYRELR